MKKGLLVFVTILTAAIILVACGGYTKDFQQLQDHYKAKYEMFDDSSIAMYMNLYAEHFEENYSANDFMQLYDNFAGEASYALATMDKDTNAWKVSSQTWDAFYELYKGNVSSFRKKMDKAKEIYEATVGMSMEDYLAEVTDDDVMEAYARKDYSVNSPWY